MRFAALLSGFVLVLACGEGGSPEAPDGAVPQPAPPRAEPEPAEPPAPPAQPALADGAALFRARCAMCHGETGDGSGTLAGGLDPRPRDFRKPEWQASVQDADIETVIAKGGPSVGLSPIMPAHPDLDPGQLASLRAYVRSLGR